jgi:hypothetical protein
MVEQQTLARLLLLYYRRELKTVDVLQTRIPERDTALSMSATAGNKEQ